MDNDDPYKQRAEEPKPHGTLGMATGALDFKAPPQMQGEYMPIWPSSEPTHNPVNIEALPEQIPYTAIYGHSYVAPKPTATSVTPESEQLPDEILEILDKMVRQIRHLHSLNRDGNAAHDYNNLKMVIGSEYAMIKKVADQPDDVKRKKVARLQVACEREIERSHSNLASVKLLGHYEIARYFGIVPTQEDLDQARSVILQEEVATELSREHACDIKIPYSVIAQNMLDFSKYSLINQLIGIETGEALAVDEYVHERLSHINMELSNIDQRKESIVKRLDELVEKELKDMEPKFDFMHMDTIDLREIGIYGLSYKELERWHNHMKYDVLGVVRPEELKNAVNDVVDRVIWPVKVGQPGSQIALYTKDGRVYSKVSGEQAYELGNALKNMANKFGEHQDIALVMTESNWYTKSSGAMRILANKVIRSVMSELGKECPELKDSVEHGSERLASQSADKYR